MAEYYDDEEMRRRRRARRRKEMRKRKRRQALFRKLSPLGLAAVLIIIIIAVIAGRGGRKEKSDEGAAADRSEAADGKTDAETETDAETGAEEETDGLPVLLTSRAGRTAVFLQEKCLALGEEKKAAGKQTFQYAETGDTLRLGGEVFSEHAILVDTAGEEILAMKDAKSRLVPASMTKVLTLLVAVEHIDDLDDEFVITSEITDYCFRNDCSVAGYATGETVTIRDLLYGAILPSGGDGALGLAVYTAGSQEAFVELMNRKLEELGLSGSAHFTNCIGIYDSNHYCTAYDMAVIMEAAMQNEICREVLSTRIYTTSGTEEHPDGIELSNWFLRRIEDKDTGGMTIYGKTGYVAQSGSCAVSCAVDQNGKAYICVTTNAVNRWRCIEDHAALYKRFSEN
ncbi:MAG: serine hydrolase [Blautia sp.]|nr:serine hydrolase [Blautia sp.]MCM1201769.1 serine hydrolase [Bacteroides fragilis]